MINDDDLIFAWSWLIDQMPAEESEAMKEIMNDATPREGKSSEKAHRYTMRIQKGNKNDQG